MSETDQPELEISHEGLLQDLLDRQERNKVRREWTLYCSRQSEIDELILEINIASGAVLPQL